MQEGMTAATRLACWMAAPKAGITDTPVQDAT